MGSAMDASIRSSSLHDLSHLGMRLVIGVFFIVHSQAKFGSGFGQFLSSLGISPELAVPVGLLELLGGILLIIGILSRIASSLIAVDMLGAIIYVKKVRMFSGNQGIELELLALAMLLSVIILGPGRLSIAHAVKKIPRILH